MRNAMNSVAINAYHTGAKAIFLLTLLVLTGCALPQPPARPAVYDFGPGTLHTPPAGAAAALAPLVVAEIETTPALDSTAILYRLAYANAQQLRPYAQARWSMTPAQLLRQRLREQLGQRRALLNPGDAGVPGPLTLRLELEEFSQQFETPETSMGWLRLRATVLLPGPGGENLVAQRSLTVQRPAPSADAPGAVRALTGAADAAVQELDQWLLGLTR